jgi:hypothetical protein
VQAPAQTIQQSAPALKQIGDNALGAAAILAGSTPLWIDQAMTWGGLLAMVAGLVLVGIRIYVGVLEARIKRKELEE